MILLGIRHLFVVFVVRLLFQKHGGDAPHCLTVMDGLTCALLSSRKPCADYLNDAVLGRFLRVVVLDSRIKIKI